MILPLPRSTNDGRTQEHVATPTAVFVGGYITVWTLFSLAATALQEILHGAGLLSPMMDTSSGALGGTVLIAAGLYQWTPLKGSCLRHCQSPLHFITQHWRAGCGRGAPDGSGARSVLSRVLLVSDVSVVRR